MIHTFIKRAKIYWKVWKTIAVYGLAETFVNRWTNVLFFFGKSMRFGMTLFFLFLLSKTIKGIAGYTTDQVIIFYLIYQFTDTLAQVFFRGVYEFSWKVKSGELDFFLSKPMNPLFRIMTGKPDLIDAIFFIPTTILSVYLLLKLAPGFSSFSLLAVAVLLINGFLIAAAFHIFVVCLGIITTEVDNAVMMYRDLNALSRFPVNMYREPLRTTLFFLIPVGMMNTIPAQVLLNVTPSHSILVTLCVGVGFFLLSLQTWKYSVRKYTSAGG